MPSRKAARPALTGATDPRFRQARQELHQLGYFLKGTVLKRMMKCGQSNCACQRDPSQRHGPYFEWTYKVKGKTVNVKLSPQAAPLYQAATNSTANSRPLWPGWSVYRKTAVARLAKQATNSD